MSNNIVSFDQVRRASDARRICSSGVSSVGASTQQRQAAPQRQAASSVATPRGSEPKRGSLAELSARQNARVAFTQETVQSEATRYLGTAQRGAGQTVSRSQNVERCQESQRVQGSARGEACGESRAVSRSASQSSSRSASRTTSRTTRSESRSSSRDTSRSQSSANSPCAQRMGTSFADTPRRARRAHDGYTPRDPEERAISWARSKSQKTIDRIVLSVAAVFVVAAVGVVLYPAAKDYYVSVREADRVAAELAAVTERNETLQGTIDYLSTDTGVEDWARQEFGWTQEGEVSVDVEGLEDSTVSAYVANVPSGSVEAPETWYSPFLDAFFGID